MIPSLSASTNLFLNSLSRLQLTINTATAQLSSGYRISQPSDAPDQISPLLQLQASLSHNQAVAESLTSAQADVSTADQAVSTAIQLLDQARSIGAQGANGTATDTTRAGLAQQVTAILQQMVSLTNTQVAGRYIFSGDQDTSPPYALASSNPPVQLAPPAAAKVIPPNDTVVFNIQTAAGPIPPITLTGQTGDTLQIQLGELNTQLQGTGLTASLDGSGNLQFQSANAFSISAQATGDPSLVSDATPATANNTALNSYRYTPQAPLANGGQDVRITVGGTTATITAPVAPQPADIAAINTALAQQGITSVTAVLDQTDGASISFQGSAPFSVSDDHAASGTFAPDANSVAPIGVNRLITPAATRQIELNDHSFTTIDQTAESLFDHRNADDSPAQDNVFFALNSLQVALSDSSNPNQPAEITAAQASLQAASNYLNTQETFYGNAENRITAATNQISTENVNLQRQISAIRDTDVVQTALELTSAETQNQAAMEAEAKVPHTSLFDFMG